MNLLPSDLLETGWVQGCLAIDADGVMVMPESPDACAWDILGAIEVTMGGTIDGERLKAALHDHLTERGWESTVDWHDDRQRTQAEVVSLARYMETALGLRTRREGVRGPRAKAVARREPYQSPWNVTLPGCLPRRGSA